MNPKSIHDKLAIVIDQWEGDLKAYSQDELLRKPDTDSWSIGQVYMHLIKGTLNFHLQQVRLCNSNNENAHEKKNMKGIMSYYILGGMPPIKIKVPASPEYTPAQPKDIDEIYQGLNQVRIELKQIWPTIASAAYNGKTAHPGFGYLNASEWHRLVLMHWRHHRRQKARLDAFLKTSGE